MNKAGSERLPARFMLVSQMKRKKEEEFEGRLRASATDGSWAYWLYRTGVSRCSVYRYERLLFVYVELAEDGFKALPEECIWMPEWHTDLLDCWPGSAFAGERYAARLVDIFHDDKPSVDVPWRREGYRPERRIGSLARLKAEKVASYVFYHYQLQEEKPRSFNKYYTIGSLEQWIFSYAEEPVANEPSHHGLLATSNTPEDWPGTMAPHFELWPDTDEAQIWRPLEEVISLEGLGS